MATRTVLHMISSGGLYGAEQVILGWMRSMPGHDFAVLVFTAPGRRDSPLAREAARLGAAVRAVGHGKFRLRRTWREVARFAAAVKPDVIHSHGHKALFYGTAASLKMKCGRVHTNHGFVGAGVKQRLFHGMEICIVRLAPPARLVLVSRSLGERFRRFGVRPRIVDVLPNAVDIDRVRDDSAPAALPPEVARGLGGKRVIAYVGRLSPEKGPDVLIRAMQTISRAVPDALLLVVGDGPMGPALKRQAVRAKLGPHLRFLGFRKEARAILGRSEVVVMPSRSEGLPMTLLEAMSLSRPVVASAVGGMPQVIRHESNGLVVPPGDPDALSQSVLRLLSDRTLARRIGANARATVERRFNVRERVSRLAEIYRSAAD